MPVSSLHQQYKEFHAKWIRCRNAVEGSDAIKAAGQYYLPQLQDQTIEEYTAYVKRANFYPASGRTKEGLHGFIFRKEPKLGIPEELADVQNDMTLEGVNLKSFAKDIVAQVIEVGRYGTLIDWSDDEMRPVCVNYRAEDIINWRPIRVQGRTEIGMLVLRESTFAVGAKVLSGAISELGQGDTATTASVPTSTAAKTGPPNKTPDPFIAAVQVQYRVYWLRVDADGMPYVARELWQKQGTGKQAKEVMISSFVPSRRGMPLSCIPFVFHGPSDINIDCQKPPLLDLVDVNLSHYRTSADIEEAAHYTACPMLYAFGVPKETVMRVGSRTAIISDKPEAKAGYVEYTGAGLTPLQSIATEKKEQMAAIGARLLEAPPAGVEAADTIEMRATGEKSVLSQIADACSDSVIKCLQWCAWWNNVGDDPDDIEGIIFQLNQDFVAGQLPPLAIQALVMAWQSGAISKETLFDCLQRGEIIAQGISFEEEEGKIQATVGIPEGAAEGTPAKPNAAPPPINASTKPKFTIRVRPKIRNTGNKGDAGTDLPPVSDQAKGGTSAAIPASAIAQPAIGTAS